MKTSRLLGVVIALQVLTLAGQWLGQPSAPAARADVAIPNPGERQLAILDELKTMNGKFDRLLDLMHSGDLQVKVTKEDPKK